MQHSEIRKRDVSLLDTRAGQGTGTGEIRAADCIPPPDQNITDVLLRPREIKALLASIRTAAQGAGESPETLQNLDRAADGVEGRPSEYLAFGFDPWKG